MFWLLKKKKKQSVGGTNNNKLSAFITFLDFTEERDHNDDPLTRIA